MVSARMNGELHEVCWAPSNFREGAPSIQPHFSRFRSKSKPLGGKLIFAYMSIWVSLVRNRWVPLVQIGVLNHLAGQLIHSYLGR